MLDPLNIILLAVAAIVLWKLKSVLGERTGLEKRPQDPAPMRVERDNVVRLPGQNVPDVQPGLESEPVWKGYAEKNSAVAIGLEAIVVESRGFDVPSFMGGAKAAYEMILEAFAKGDKSALKPLLSKDVLESFAAAVDQRVKDGQSMAMQFVGVKSAKIESAKLDGKRAQIAVRFVGEMISSVTDRDGNVIEGDNKHVRDVHDLWTFERDISTRDPNWKLIDTSDDNP